MKPTRPQPPPKSPPDPAPEDAFVLERYLAGDLSPTEAAAFEESFLDSESVLDELEADERFGRALAAEMASETSAAAEHPVTSEDVAPQPLPFEREAMRRSEPPAPGVDRSARRRPGRALERWAAAAVFTAACVALGFLWQRNTLLEQRLADLEAPRAAPPVLRLEPLRTIGDDVAIVLRLDEATHWVVLELSTPPTLDAASCSLVHDEAVAWAGPVTVDPWGRLTLLMPAARLEAGRHDLICAASDGGGDPVRAAFVVARSERPRDGTQGVE